MNYKIFLATLFLTLSGTLLADAEETLLQGVQVTTEEKLVSGKPYLLYYVGNQASCYVKAGSELNYFKVEPNDKLISDSAVFILTQAGSTWKIKSRKTGKYFPIPSGTANDATSQSQNFQPAESGSAGLWTLNFLDNGTVAPYYGDKAYSLNRHTGKLHAFSYGEANVNQLKIYELAFTATQTEVYTIKNSSDVAPTGITDNRWIFVPTGYGNFFYLYNINAQKFARPDWTLSETAVPVSVSYYGITTQDGKTFYEIGGETRLTIVKNADVTATEYGQLTTALGKLLANNEKVKKIENVNEIVEVTYSDVYGVETVTDSDPNKGWYALRIHSDSDNPDYAGNFLYSLRTEYVDAKGWKYPLSHGGIDYPKHPTPDSVFYYVRLWPVTRSSGTYYHWQVPTGKYVVNYLNNYPIIFNRPASDFIIGKNADGTFYFQSSDFRAKAWEDHIDKTARKYMESSTHFEIYKMNPAANGLTAWRVIFNEGADDIKLKCTREDVSGPNEVYNRGYFFLPTGQTPVGSPVGSSEFQINGEKVIATVNSENHTITVTYAPDVCFTADNVTVVQGSRTTGIGNQKQVLLRMKVEPQAPCTLSSLDVTLAGAEFFDKVEAYLTTADQLHADGVSSTSLGSKDSGLTGDEIENIAITLSGCPLLKMGETYYVWLTADIKEETNEFKFESEIVDAAILNIGYVNGKSETKTVDVTSKGDPEGNMRIFKAQSFVRVSTENNDAGSQYYRNPAILNIGENTVLAFCDYRYDNVNGLGKDYDGSDNGHRMDVIVRKSTDNGKTWGNVTIVASGMEGTESVPASGYAGPAVAYNGSKVVCLMAKGSNAYDSSEGLKDVAISTSEDGVTWTAPQDLAIDWGGLKPTSFYVTPGKGVTYSDNRVAFVINAKVGGRTQEYLLYSGESCANWTVDPTPLSGKGKESKVELHNDGSLLVMGKKPISKDCNNDLLYFTRSGEVNPFDGVLQTVIWKYEGDRMKDMRLYASFDKTATWKELFYIQPGNAATSSMQRVSGGLAICFEDGSIGNDEKDGCYALTYVVIDEKMIAEQSADVNTATIIFNTNDGSAPFVNGSGWTKSVVTNTKSGIAGITISTDYTAFNREGNGTRRFFDMRPSAAGATDQITISAPSGYVIQSYTITGYNKVDGETYTLTAGEQTANLNGGKDAPATLTVNNIFEPSTTFTFANSNSTKSSYALITNFTVTLTREEYGVRLNVVNGKSYATLYYSHDLRQTDETTKAYYITGVAEDGIIELTETNDEGREIPKNTAVILINSEGETYTEFAIVNGLTTIAKASENMLVGTLENMTLDLTKANGNRKYSLGTRQAGSTGTPVVGFYQNGISDFTLGANRAYLVTPASPGVSGSSRGFDLTYGDDATAIKEIEREVPAIVLRQPTDDYYDLHGRKVSGTPRAKGIYVRSGKKIVIH